MNVLADAFSVFLVTTLVMALPWPAALLQRKPWSCSVCRTSWVAIALGLIDWSFTGPTFEPFLRWTAAAGGALCIAAVREWVLGHSWGQPPLS